MSIKSKNVKTRKNFWLVVCAYGFFEPTGNGVKTKF